MTGFGHSKEVVATRTVATIEELRQALSNLCFAEPDSVYVTINSDAVKLTLIEEKLTDGSVVYNIELSEASKS